MKTVLIGCGNISRCHLDAIDALDGVTLAAVADIRPDRAEAAAEKHRCRAYGDWREMLRQEQPDVVHICTPHDLHVEMAVAALESGANVLCEKPAAIDHPSLMRLQRAQTESGKQLGICFQNRYNVGVLEALRLMREGKTGSLVSIRANVDWCRGADYYSDDWHGIKAREGGGVLVNQAVHTLDLLQMFAFSPAVSVQAHIANDHLQGVIDEEDTALLRAVFQNGVMGQLHATTAFQSNVRVEIDLFFQHDTLRLSGPVLQRLEDDGTATTLSGTDTAAGSKAYWGTGHPALIADYYRCIRENVPFPIDAFEGGKAVELFLAAYRSAEQNGEKVDVE